MNNIENAVSENNDQVTIDNLRNAGYSYNQIIELLYAKDHNVDISNMSTNMKHYKMHTIIVKQIFENFIHDNSINMDEYIKKYHDSNIKYGNGYDKLLIIAKSIVAGMNIDQILIHSPYIESAVLKKILSKYNKGFVLPEKVIQNLDKYSQKQLSVLIKYLNKGDLVTVVSSPKISAKVMKFILRKNNRYNIANYSLLEYKMIDEIFEWFTQDIKNMYQKDIDSYLERGFSSYQLRFIRLGIMENLDVSIYSYPTMPINKMIAAYRILRLIKEKKVKSYQDELKKVLTYGLLPNVSEKVLTNIQYILEFGNTSLEENIKKVSYIINGNFSVLQKIEILKGLKKGVDINIYSDEKLSPDHMRIIRKILKKSPKIFDDKKIDTNMSLKELSQWILSHKEK